MWLHILYFTLTITDAVYCHENAPTVIMLPHPDFFSRNSISLATCCLGLYETQNSQSHANYMGVSHGQYMLIQDIRLYLISQPQTPVPNFGTSCGSCIQTGVLGQYTIFIILEKVYHCNEFQWSRKDTYMVCISSLIQNILDPVSRSHTQCASLWKCEKFRSDKMCALLV